MIADLALRAGTLLHPTRPGALAEFLAMLLRAYARARQRRALARLDARLLRDAGIDSADAARESAKPFWRE